jgi:L-alanine-DL-glutamate epimerase-like enolase superfamily enzyme
MKIEDVEAIILTCEYPEPLITALCVEPTRSAILVRIRTDDGLTGIGESACFGGGEHTVRTMIETELKPLLVGEDPLYIEKLWTKMFTRTYQHGRRGVSICAMGGVDIALWDIMGKAAGLPLYKLLGGNCDKVRGYASAGFYSATRTVDKLAKEMAGYRDEGFTAMKMKVAGAPLDTDVERVKAVREAIGPDSLLMIDANNGLTAEGAIRMARRLELYDIFWFEEPVPTDDIEGSAKVAAALDMAVAGYETASGRFDFRELILRKAVDIVQPDVVWCGGISEVRKIAAMASAHNLLCVPHTYSTALAIAADSHMIASISNGMMIEVDRHENPLRDELLVEAIELDKEGYIHVPQKPGLGVEVDPKAIKKFGVAA